MRFLARFFLVVFSLITLACCLLSTSVAHAQYYANPYTAPNTDANVPANLHTYTQSLFLEILSALTCQVIGQDPMSANHECLGFNPTTGRIGYAPSTGGAIGFVGDMIATLYTPPIHTSEYIHYVAGNFGLAKHTYAASLTGCGVNGCGFDQLSTLLKLWTTLRNISYFVFVLAFIIIGFAIMLRVKIDPRTVMSIENQIPKIIVGLLLVTFSYAIAGFLIDMMYAVTYLEINVIASSQTIDKSTLTQIHNAEKSDMAYGNPLGFANDIIPGGILGMTAGSSGNVGSLIRGLFGNKALSQNGIVPTKSTSNCNSTDFWNFIGNFFCNIGSTVGDVMAGVIGYLISYIISALAFLVIFIAILVALFRVWLSLLLTYVNILLEIILAPFIIIFGLFPGSKIGFGSWIKSMIGNLLAFPVTIALFLLAGVFMDSFAPNSNNLFVPPLIGNPNLAVGNGQSPIGYIIALGMILLTPNVVGLTRGLVGAGENKALGGIFAGIGVGGKATGGIFKQTVGALFGNEIEYGENGTIKTLNNPIDRFRKGLVGRLSGRG